MGKKISAKKSARKQKANKEEKPGFTVFEILVVVFVIGILATLVATTYNNIQRSARNLQRQDDIKTVEALLETYAATHGGKYPATTDNPVANWRTVDVRTDKNCFNGSQQADWVPGMTGLPQSIPNTGSDSGVDGKSGCYLYASNGDQYVLSAWNMVTFPQTKEGYYRRLGFKSFQTPTSTQFYTCNAVVEGGANGNTYDIKQDYYKHSYTVSNITDCDETPPPGA